MISTTELSGVLTIKLTENKILWHKSCFLCILKCVHHQLIKIIDIQINTVLLLFYL